MALLQEYFFNTVVALGVPLEDNSVRYTATGFLYGYPAGRNEKGKQTYWVFLVTNRHVIENATDIVVRFNAQSGANSKTYRLPMSNSEQAVHWATHPDSDIDIAVLLIDTFLPEMEKSDIKLSFVCEDVHITTLDIMRNSEFAEGNEVFVLGFPLGMAGITQNYVILRQGTVARIRDWYNNDAKSFLIDSFIFPGNSGGPVFAKPVFAQYGTKPSLNSSLIGMVSGYLPYTDTAYSHQTGRPKIVFEENSGLAEVVPIDAIQKTISVAVSRYSN